MLVKSQNVESFLKNMTVIYAPDARETNCPDVYKTALMKPQ